MCTLMFGGSLLCSEPGSQVPPICGLAVLNPWFSQFIWGLFTSLSPIKGEAQGGLHERQFHGAGLEMTHHDWS
jgi:hypothetical protein